MLSKIVQKSFEQTEYIVSESENHQKYEENHTYCLRNFQELVGRLASCNHFIQCEQYVSSIQSRNRQNVHHRKNY